MNISDCLKEIRAQLDLSQSGISKELGCSLTAWQGYEAGKNIPGGKVLKQLAIMGFNVNWILTGDGPIRLSEGEKANLSYEDAHRFIRQQIRVRHKLYELLIAQDENSKITEEQLRSYVVHEGYVPTPNQLIGILKRMGLTEHELIKPLFDTDLRLAVSRKKLDLELLKCTLVAIEDETLKNDKLSATEKAELASFIYSANQGTDYSIEKLKRFFKAALTIIEQTGDLEKISNAQANEVLYTIAHRLVKNQ